MIVSANKKCDAVRDISNTLAFYSWQGAICALKITQKPLHFIEQTLRPFSKILGSAGFKPTRDFAVGLFAR
jgi:hypothetical protein